MTVVLSFENVSKNFGALKVTDDLSFKVSEGEALGILGPNGAGKTTVFNLITGGVAPDAGQILFNGHDITKLAPHKRCRAGIGRSYQVALPFEGMTVFENLLVAAMYGGQIRSTNEANGRCVDLLARTGLLDKANRLAGSLTLLDRKRLELARALATDPESLLLDEIAGGLTEAEAHALVALVNDIRARGRHHRLDRARRARAVGRGLAPPGHQFRRQACRGRSSGGDGEPGSEARLYGHRDLEATHVAGQKPRGALRRLPGLVRRRSRSEAGRHRRSVGAERRRQVHVLEVDRRPDRKQKRRDPIQQRRDLRTPFRIASCAMAYPWRRKGGGCSARCRSRRT